MIEFDDKKDLANRAKHGLGLSDAERFDWSSALIATDRRKDYGEIRYRAFGPLDETIVALAFTVRGANIRVISLRKAHWKEVSAWLARKN